MQANSLETTPGPACSPVKTVVVVVFTPKMPITSNPMPSAAIPSSQNAQPVLVATYAAVSTPEPPRSLVVVIAPVQTPVSPDSPPVTLIISVESLTAIQMYTNPSITSPSPLHAAVKLVVIVVATIQAPVRSHSVPSRTSPAPQDAQTVQVPTNAASSSPDPAGALVVMVATPQMPIRTHSAPVALVVSIKRAQSVEVNTNPSEPSPIPTVTAVQTVIVMVATIQAPIPSDNNPLTSSPSLEQAHAVQMASYATSAPPEPACWPVIMIAPP